MINSALCSYHTGEDGLALAIVTDVALESLTFEVPVRSPF
jgi:hypothetical protein